MGMTGEKELNLRHWLIVDAKKLIKQLKGFVPRTVTTLELRDVSSSSHYLFFFINLNRLKTAVVELGKVQWNAFFKSERARLNVTSYFFGSTFSYRSPVTYFQSCVDSSLIPMQDR